MDNIDLVEILIVEDNPYDAELAVRTLKTQHLANKIFIAEDGEEALDFIFRLGKYSGYGLSSLLKVIFLDLNLPKVKGLDVLKEIKSNPATKKVPVVILTSSREESDVKSAYELGANSYIVKPVAFDAYVDVITKTVMYWLVVNESPI
jgi:two-component system response regulator